MKPTAALFLILFCGRMYSQIYVGETCKIMFFSETKLENIDAVNTVTKPVFNAATGDFAIKASQNAFTFKSAFMQEHYNENYVESEKFPYATFMGKMSEAIDYSKNGNYHVHMVGKLDMHGVTVPRTVDGTIIVKDGMLILDSKFNVKVADHHIKVPSLYVEKIAESVQVTFHTEMILLKK